VSTLIVILVFGASVLLFDTVASLVFRDKPDSYRKLAPFSIVLYTLSGVFAARFAEGDALVRLLHAALAGAAVAAVESTLGWIIASAIGPGKVPQAATNPSALIVRVLILNVVVGAFAGVIGGAMSLLVQR